jgi:hypothetical protein
MVSEKFLFFALLVGYQLAFLLFSRNVLQFGKSLAF